jgi:DnaK suppressor protein
MPAKKKAEGNKKKAPPKKSVVAKIKSSIKKAITKKASTKKVATKKATPKKAAPKKATTKKVAPKKTTAKKATTKKAAPKKATVKKAAPKKVTTKKAAVTKTTTKKVAAKKTPAKKTTAKKAAPKKATPVKKPLKKTVKKIMSTSKKIKQEGVEKKVPTKQKISIDKKVPTKKIVVKKVTPRVNTKKKTVRKMPASTGTPLTIMGIPAYQEADNEEYMNNTQREHVKNILFAWRKLLMEEVDRTVSHMKDEAANFPDPADRASQEEEFSLELRTRDRERKLIKKIEDSLENLSDEDFGYCETCGIEIGIRRLEARPTATLCIDCKTLAEIKERQNTGG